MTRKRDHCSGHAGSAAMMLAASLGIACTGSEDTRRPTENDASVKHGDAGDTRTDVDATRAEPARSYADVVGVSASGSNGAYFFDVSVESADIDCSRFADFWEVLGSDEALIYRRILVHSHTDENGTSDPNAPGNTFTRRGGPIAIEASDSVVVRAHMSVGGYDGMAMRGSVASGFVEAPDIDAEFAARVEDDEPQPDGCLF